MIVESSPKYWVPRNQNEGMLIIKYNLEEVLEIRLKNVIVHLFPSSNCNQQYPLSTQLDGIWKYEQSKVVIVYTSKIWNYKSDSVSLVENSR